jgi:hypothetical protein
MIEELKALAEKASQIDGDIRYYGGGSKHNEAAEQLTALVRSNLPAIISALSAVPAAPDEDWLEEVISDSLEMDWRPRDAAKAIIARWSESQAIAALEGK